MDLLVDLHAARASTLPHTPPNPCDALKRPPATLQTPVVKSKVAILPTVVESYLKDLRGPLGRDTDSARMLLAKLVGHITLRRTGDRLVAELRGNLPALLEMDEPLYQMQ